MSPAAADFGSPIASQKDASSGAESRPSSGFDFGAVFPGPGGEFRRSESVGPGKSRPRLVKVRKQGGLQHPRSRTGGGGNGGFVFGADPSGVNRDASEAEKAEFVFGLREKEESFAKGTEPQPGKSSNKDVHYKDISDQSKVPVFGGNYNNGSLPNTKFENCSSETEAKKCTFPNFVFGDSWFNSKSNLDSGKEESNEDIRRTPFVFGSSSNVPTKVSDEVKPDGEGLENFCSGNVETRVNDPTGAAFKPHDEMRKLSMSDEPEKAGISKAKLFSTSGNFSKPMRPSSVSRRSRRNHLREKSCKGHSFGSETANGNISTSSKLDDGVSRFSGAEPFTFQAGVGETDVFGQIRKDQGVDSTESNVSFSSNYPSESVNFVEEKNYSGSTDPKTPLFTPSALRQSLFPKLDKKPDVKNRSAKDKRLRDTRRKLKNLFPKNGQAQDNASKDSTLPEETNTSECYSPMDFSPYQESTSTSIQPNIHSKSPSVSNGTCVAPAESAAKFSRFGDTKSYLFSATPVEQSGSSIRRRYRRRSRIGVGNDTFVIKPRTNINPELSSVQSSPFCQNVVDKAEAVSKIKQGNSFSTKVHETCQNWRIRGNEAYKNGDLSKAETFYTQGIVSVPSNERSGYSLEPLLLCHSNRAAARMHLQRVREAIGDCETAISLDPNFLKAHSRAANCHLLLGEIEQSLQYFSKCLEIGSGVCLDRKIMLDAVDGQQKAQKVAECTAQSAKLLEEKIPDSALTSLEMISEALSICPYSEKLLKLKADALITVRRHEEAIQLCEKSLSLAEKNFTSETASESYSLLRLWRWFLISKCYFLLGRLEAALPLLDKLKQVGSIDNESARKDVQSAISLETTIRGLLQTKNAGNEAFKAGRYSEAVEHYTAALCRNFESWHFAAICFCNRAAAHQALGQIADAIADCSLAIALDGNYRKAVSRRAILLEMIRDYGEAASDLRRLISVIENQPCDKSKQSGSSGGSLKALRQAQIHLPVLEQEAKSRISLDFYLILGSKPDDTSADIKKAYRKAALKHHPDKAGQFIVRSESGDEGRLWREISQEVHKDADRLFKMIGEAYAVLSDSSKRSQYDLEEDLRKTSKANNGSTTQRTQSGDQYSYRSNSYTRPDNFQESFNNRNFRDHWKTYGNSYSRW